MTSFLFLPGSLKIIPSAGLLERIFKLVGKQKDKLKNNWKVKGRKAMNNECNLKKNVFNVVPGSVQFNHTHSARTQQSLLYRSIKQALDPDCTAT